MFFRVVFKNLFALDRWLRYKGLFWQKSFWPGFLRKLDGQIFHVLFWIQKKSSYKWVTVAFGAWISHAITVCLNTCSTGELFFFWLSVLLMVRIRGGFCNVRTLGMMVTKGRHSLNFGEDEFLWHQSQMPQLSEVLIFFLARIDCTSFHAARFIFNYIP